MSARPLVGPLLMGIGTAHVALTRVVAEAGFRSILRDGVVDAVQPRGRPVEDGPERELAFWFASTGAGLVALGAVAGALERTPGQVPRTLPVVLAALGLWGVVPLPRSPFWVFFPLAVVAERRRRLG